MFLTVINKKSGKSDRTYLFFKLFHEVFEVSVFFPHFFNLFISMDDCGVIPAAER